MSKSEIKNTPDGKTGPIADPARQLLAAFEMPSQPGSERQVIQQVVAAVAEIGLDARRLERLKTAVGEAAMNAMEHGSGFRVELPIWVEVSASPKTLAVRITDHGSGSTIREPELPDLDAKIAGLQSPRGWGLFLIKNLVDEMQVTFDEHHHTIELVVYR